MSADQQMARRFVNGMELMHWVPESSKWSDHGNNVWCYALRGGGWTVTHRYSFDAVGKVRDLTFSTQEEALSFYVTYLHLRASNMLPRT